jgi:CRISPR-associated exonuclease Cas4
MESVWSSGGKSIGEVETRELLPLSGLQHMVFCDRQAALIHVDGLWADNAFTVEGSHLHRVVDEGKSSSGGGVRVVRGLILRSSHLGLSGKADAVELHPAPPNQGVDLAPAHPGNWTIRPVEYKRGRPKAHRADEVQLCAQAICLEEQFRFPIEEGDIFYGQPRRRSVVRFDAELRMLTSDVARDFHALVRSDEIPTRMREKKCERCSLIDICMPLTGRSGRSVRSYISQELEWAPDDGDAP